MTDGQLCLPFPTVAAITVSRHSSLGELCAEEWKQPVRPRPRRQWRRPWSQDWPVRRRQITVRNPAKSMGIRLRAKIVDKKGYTAAISIYDAYLGKW